MARMRTLLLLGICFLLCGTHTLIAQALASPQSDVSVVRAAYAKLVFEARLYAIRTSALGESQSAPTDEINALSVVLSDIKTGPVSALKPVTIEDLVTKPSGSTLLVTPVNWSYKTAAGRILKAQAASVAWSNAGYLAEDWSVPFGELFDKGVIDSGYTRYASFTAKVSYLGRLRQYQALFLFGLDASGQPIALPIDHIVGASALQSVIQAPVSPDPLLAEPFRHHPATAPFIESLRAAPGCTFEPLTQMCCDEATEHCGVSAGTLQLHGFAVPVGKSLAPNGIAPATCVDCSVYNSSGTPDVQKDLFQNQDHFTGYHTATATFTPQCTYSGTSLPCTPLCHVAVTSAYPTETGITYVYCHKTPSNQTSLDGAGNNTCSASWGYGVGGCFACIPCSVSVTVGAAGAGGSASVTVSGGNATLWSWGVGLIAGPCPTIQ